MQEPGVGGVSDCRVGSWPFGNWVDEKDEGVGQLCVCVHDTAGSHCWVHSGPFFQHVLSARLQYFWQTYNLKTCHVHVCWENSRIFFCGWEMMCRRMKRTYLTDNWEIKVASIHLPTLDHAGTPAKALPVKKPGSPFQYVPFIMCTI